MKQPLGPSPGRVLLVFLDGVGIGPADSSVNPFLMAADRIPALTALMGGQAPTLDEPVVEGPAGRSFPLAATLDVDGTPQSGTGQAALLTGASAAEIFGRHFGPWTPVALRPLVEERSVLRRARDRGHEVSFANAYPKGWPGHRGGRRIAAPPLAARGAGVLDRHQEALASGDAVSSEIVNDGWRDKLGHDEVPSITPRAAGANLARISKSADLTLYAHYETDTAGHTNRSDAAVAALRRVDAFLDGLLSELAEDTLLLVASDHGNLEDIREDHTRNPVLGIATGPGSSAAAQLGDIREVTGFILETLGTRS
ncbi:MAG: alkaline phosphatase family protein [Gemmatimonadota bacterium]|nr:alkaline phosphatase family protein [Gemmatimonadota bacterium]MDH3424126.1 alkaline phosphatase family protein [Gemmatimonadota bacterium]